jgi:hypothetical protein
MAEDGGAGPATGGEEPTSAPIGPNLKDFRLIEKLGQGGMGIVYRAHQRSMDRPVALKLLPPQLAADEGFIARFYREARMSARLDHPNIVRGVAVGEERGVYYFAMEYVDGESLDKRLALGRLSVADAVRIALDVARALDHAHSRGLVHRDIKPANILIARDGVVKLADLGLAKTSETDLTQVGGSMGTPSYMAPEQGRDARSADQRSDIYALGATLYHLLTGERPFRGADDVQLAKESARYEPLRQRNPEVPPALGEIVDKMMAPDPADRHQTPAELVNELAATGLAASSLSWIGGEGYTAAPTYAAPRFEPRRSGARRQSWSLVGALAVLAVVGGVAYQLGERVQTRPRGESKAPAVVETEESFLGRAFELVGTGDFAEARDLLRDARDIFPASEAIEHPLRELDKGVLVMAQYQRPGETSTVLPVKSLQNLELSHRDNYRFALLPSRDCHVYVFQADERPSIATIFPNESYSSIANPLDAGRVHWIPERRDDPSALWMHLDERPGREKVYFLALTHPLRDVDAFAERLLRGGREIEKTIARDLASFVEPGGPVSSCFAGDALQTFEFKHL